MAPEAIAAQCGTSRSNVYNALQLVHVRELVRRQVGHDLMALDATAVRVIRELLEGDELSPQERRDLALKLLMRSTGSDVSEVGQGTTKRAGGGVVVNIGAPGEPMKPAIDGSVTIVEG